MVLKAGSVKLTFDTDSNRKLQETEAALISLAAMLAPLCITYEDSPKTRGLSVAKLNKILVHVYRKTYLIVEKR